MSLPDFTAWLSRRPAGPKPRKRVRRVSAKRQRDAKAYGLLRAAYLQAHPKCQVCRAKASQDIHHKAGRLGGNYLNPDTFCAICRDCHRRIHDHPSEARAQGLLY